MRDSAVLFHQTENTMQFKFSVSIKVTHIFKQCNLENNQVALRILRPPAVPAIDVFRTAVKKPGHRSS